jgi:hypothetical protein
MKILSDKNKLTTRVTVLNLKDDELFSYNFY